MAEFGRGGLPAGGSASDPSKNAGDDEKDYAENREPDKTFDDESKYRQNGPNNKKEDNKPDHNDHLFFAFTRTNSRMEREIADI
ncbi:MULTISPECIES: hypothetical protein [Arthrobacter]|uniref:hypothetical protein n=1 Tax=Arthrobacter TaxID=1663 RepID=UPI00140449F8|nr:MULTISPECIES: hypothetical protein [Arthrobacter]MBT8160625.1 hypothetical protein [Arthrobacter sp. GN70]